MAEYTCTICGTPLSQYRLKGIGACKHWFYQAQGNCAVADTHENCDGMIRSAKAPAPPCVCSCHRDGVEVVTEEELAHVAMKLADLENELNRRELHRGSA